jgi:hypothetical protein
VIESEDLFGLALNGKPETGSIKKLSASLLVWKKKILT